MRTRTKVWLIIAASLVLIGCILFAGVMTTLKWNFMELATVHYETNTYEISEAFDGISMNTDTADIVFILSDDSNCRVECYEETNAKHSVTVEDGTLTVEWIDERSLCNLIGYIGLNFGSPRITVYLPEAEYVSLLIHENTGDIEISGDFHFEDVSISLSTGDIHTENMTADTLELSVSTGNVYLTDIVCKNLISTGSTGDIFLKNVVATDIISIERSTGDVRFDRCDAAEISVETNTGDITGTFLSGKTFLAETDTGRIDVPQSLTGGRCEIKTDTGNITLGYP